MRESYITFFRPCIHPLDRDNNMGLARYIMALGVLIAHFNLLCGADYPWVISSANCVGCFFALSGFVLGKSLLKGQSFGNYCERRAWRIFPSYFFVVIVCALLLVCFSTLSPKEYFANAGFWKYLGANLSFINWLWPTLPGVFDGFDIPAVNGSLWTMKVEIQLSLSAPILIFICYRFRLNLKKAIAVILALALAYRLGMEYMYEQTGNHIYEILGRQFFYQSLFFYFGMAAYTCYDRMIKLLNHLAFIIGGTIIVILLLYHTAFYYYFLQPFLISFIVILLSLTRGNYAKYIDFGHNISYEIYLCHFPICQLIALYGLVERLGTAAAFTICVAGTIVFAIATYAIAGRLYLTRNKPYKQVS